ncbi:MAG: hypothetical protein RR320_03365 [Oscillospiraceae bacterium]
MDISKHGTLISILIAALWIACILAGTMGHFVIGMCLGVVLMFLHMILGVAKNGIVSKKFLFYPLGIWAILWLASFTLSGYFGNLFEGIPPTFTVLGFHPSFAPTIFLYWIGGQLTLNLGFHLFKDEWLSQKDWDDFCANVKQLEEVK